MAIKQENEAVEAGPCAVLYVDDEEKSLKYFQRYFNDRFKIYTASEADEAHDILETRHDEIGILVTDYKMPGKKGIQLLEEVRDRYPAIIRVLTTAFPEMDIALAAINRGEAYRLITKPWNVDELSMTLTAGSTKYQVQRQRRGVEEDQQVLMSKVGMLDHSACLSTLAMWAGLNVRNALVPVKKFIDSIPRRLEEEDIKVEKLQNVDFWNASLKKVSSQIETTNTLLTDLYAMSRKSAYHCVDVVNVHEVVAGAIDSMEEVLAANRITVENLVDRELSPVVLDHPKVARMFELLLKRRIRQLEKGGAIIFRSEEIRSPLADGMNDTHIQISIEDERPEFAAPDDFRLSPQHIYDQEASDAECGLYLMIAHLIVYYHNGTMENQFPGTLHENLVISLPVSPREQPCP
ncbi:MAG: response regulator [Verrucomicrobiota bacterium]